MSKIHVLDLHFQGRPQCVAAFLLPAPEGPILVECGPASSRPALLQGLQEYDVRPADIRALLVTHIHLDHAGDAGWWAQQGVPVYVHPIGAPHLIDPSKLLNSAGRIYGDQMQRLWGEIVPCPSHNVKPWSPDSLQNIAGMEIQAWDSPGHARHHLAYQVGDDLLCGDVAAVRLPGNGNALSVPAPPPEFDRETWLATIDKLAALPVTTLYLTHFGRVDAVASHWQELRERILEVSDFVGQRQDMEHAALVAEYTRWQRDLLGDEATFDRYEQANPLFMSVDGLLRYWRKRS